MVLEGNKLLTYLCLWMKLASTWPRAEDVAVILLANGPRWMSQASVGAIQLCAAISENGVATPIPSLGPYNTRKLLIFLDHLHFDLIPENERGLIVWDNVNFHLRLLIRAWFITHPRMVMVFLPPYSPFLNPIEEFFSI